MMAIKGAAAATFTFLSTMTFGRALHVNNFLRLDQNIIGLSLLRTHSPRRYKTFTRHVSLLERSRGITKISAKSNTNINFVGVPLLHTVRETLRTSNILLKYSSIIAQPLSYRVTVLQGNVQQNTNDDEVNASNQEIKPTWEYTPYNSSPQRNSSQNQNQRRKLSGSSDAGTFIVPSKITIPIDRAEFELSFVKSSGAGGQNVNKVNTKVELRMRVKDAHWLPFEVRQRVIQNESNRINKDGYLTISCQEHRTQFQNRKNALDKLEDILLKSYPRPKVRKLRTGRSKSAKKRNLDDKKQRGRVKQSRGKVDY